MTRADALVAVGCTLAVAVFGPAMLRAAVWVVAVWAVLLGAMP